MRIFKFQSYVISLVKSFQVKPKFTFPEDESAILCVIFEIGSKRFYLRLFSLKFRSMIWEQEITDFLKIKIKSNIIQIDGKIGKIKIHFASAEEASCVFKNTSGIIEIKIQEVKTAIENVKKFNKKASKIKKTDKKILSMGDISAPIGFRHLNTVQMAILDKIPLKLRSTVEGERIIEQFFKENDVSEILKESTPTPVAKTPAPVAKAPSRPQRPPIKKEVSSLAFF